MFDFKLYRYDDNYMKIYDKLKNRNLNAIPSFRILKKLLNPEDGDLLLDAGCGAGHLLEYYCKDVQTTGIGVDLSDAALKRAVRFNMPFSKQDLRKLAFKDGSLDKIACFNAIEHIKEQDEVMLEFQRVLKPGGILVIGTNIRNSLCWKLYQMFITEHTHVKEFSVNEFVDFVSGYFNILEVKKSSGVFRFGFPVSAIFHYILKGDIIIKAVKK